jgi:transcriptional regulator with XRE-family HTH domain
LARSSEETDRDTGWPRWGEAVAAALARRNITINAAAERIRVRQPTLKRWIEGAVPPRLAYLPPIAELTGISHALQLELGDVLPPELCSEAHAIQVMEELRSALGDVQDVVGRAAELAFSDAGARLAGLLLSDDACRVQVTIRRAYRGRRYSVHSSTYLGIDDLDVDPVGDVTELRGRVTRTIGQSARAFGARWREQDAHDWRPPRPRLILNVPQHERPRPPGPTPAQAVPNILMLGCPYAHAEFVGAVLADALGYGYLDARYSVPMSLDRTPTDSLVTADRVAFVRQLAAHGELTRRHVWSVTDHRVLPMIADELVGAEVGCAIYVRSDDRLLARGCEVWGVPWDEAVALRDRLDQLAGEVDCPVLTVALPDELLIDERGQVDRDRLADVALLASVDVWLHLANYRYFPRGELAQGLLRSMFDDSGRPLGDPRPSMVQRAGNLRRPGGS